MTRFFGATSVVLGAGAGGDKVMLPRARMQVFTGIGSTKMSRFRTLPADFRPVGPPGSGGWAAKEREVFRPGTGFCR